MSDLNDLNKQLLEFAAEANNINLDAKEDEINLRLTHNEFKVKMISDQGEKLAWELMDLMESGEWRICERLGLCNGYYKEGTRFIDVPNWKRLVGHLILVNSV